MLNSTGLKDQLRSGVWAECALTVTFLSNISSIKNPRDLSLPVAVWMQAKTTSKFKVIW
jgi:hypothetical protein